MPGRAMSEPAKITGRSTIQIGLAISFAAGLYFWTDQNATRREQLNGLLALKIDQRLSRIEAKLGIPPRSLADEARTSSSPGARETLLMHQPAVPRRAVAFPERSRAENPWGNSSP